MKDEPESLAEALGALAREARLRQGPGAHPSPETLTAYHAGELSAAAEEEVREHLAVCRHCAQLLLGLPAFLEPPTPLLEGPDAAAEAAWEELRKRLPGPPEPTRGRSQPPTPWRSGLRPLLLAAAVLLFALVAVPLWIIARQLSSPEPPPAYVELLPTEGRRGSSQPAAVPVAVHADAATILVVHLAKEQPNLRFLVELGTSNTATGTIGKGAENAGSLPRVMPLNSRPVPDPRSRSGASVGRTSRRLPVAGRPSVSRQPGALHGGEAPAEKIALGSGGTKRVLHQDASVARQAP
jgi:hypothetical protein